MARRPNCLDYPVVTSLWRRVHRAYRRSSLRWPSCFSRSARAAAFCWPGEGHSSRSTSPCRLIIRSGNAEILIDLAVDAPPDQPGSVTIAGPTFSPEELAGRKVLALFDRAAARDFVDVYLLAQRFPKSLLLARAAEIDAGFDVQVLAEMIATLARFADADIPLPDQPVSALRAFFEEWHSELTAQGA